MNKKIIKDSQMLYLLALYFKLDTSLVILEEEDLLFLFKNKYISKIYGDENTIVLEVNPLKLESETKLDKSHDSFFGFIDSYRNLFDKNFSGATGKKGDPKNLNIKMFRFLKENNLSEKDYPDILAATKLYIENTEARFIMQADYFIYKRREGTSESEVSTLRVWLEEYLDNKKSSNNTWSELV